MFVQLIGTVNIIKKISIHKIVTFFRHKNIVISCIFIYLFYILLFRGDFLTNINCSLNCIYQKDGQCSYSKIEYSDTISNSECAYFVSASNEDLKK